MYVSRKIRARLEFKEVIRQLAQDWKDNV